MTNRETWDKLMEITQAVEDAYGLALLADCDCANSIADKAAREMHSALISATCVLLENAATLLVTMEPRSESGAA